MNECQFKNHQLGITGTDLACRCQLDAKDSEITQLHSEIQGLKDRLSLTATLTEDNNRLCKELEEARKGCECLYVCQKCNNKHFSLTCPFCYHKEAEKAMTSQIRKDFDRDFQEKTGLQESDAYYIALWAAQWFGERIKREAIDMGGDVTPDEIDQLAKDLTQ